MGKQKQAPKVEKEIKEEVTVNQPEKVWVKDWQELVLVEGSKDDARGRQYYGVKRES